jgi:uncharacterized membrane protein YcaP (DUF421 family)
VNRASAWQAARRSGRLAFVKNPHMQELLTLKVPLLETLLRATLMYLAVCGLLRLIPKRQAGNIAPHDLIGAVIVGGLAANGIMPDEASPADIFVMITVILLWNFVLDWIGDRVPVLRHFLREPPTRLVQNGRVLRASLRREMLTEEELFAQLRKQGIEDLDRVKEAFLETDGQISVIEADPGASRPKKSIMPAETRGDEKRQR